MLEHCSEGDQSKSDKRRISLSDFLYVSMVCFVSPNIPQEEHAHDSFPVGADHPPCEEGSVNEWNEGAEVAACLDVSPVPVPLKASNLEDRRFSGPEVSSDGSSSSPGTAGSTKRDADREGSSTHPRFSRQHICVATREPSNGAPRGATYNSSKTVPMKQSKAMADFHGPVTSSDDGQCFLNDEGIHTSVGGEKCRSPMELLESAKADHSTSPVRVTY